MPYELHVNASIAGQQELQRLTSVTESQKSATDKLNEALYGLKGATEKQTEAQLRYLTQLSKTEEWTLRYKTALTQETAAANSAASATDRQTQAMTRLGQAHGGSISQIQAVGGALRTLEGVMPIRAAERFLTLIPGIGTALQAAFPIFGAVAFIEVMDRIVEKAGQLYNAWDPIVKAQKESLKLMEESDKKYDSLISKANSYRLDQYEREHGRAARLRLESGEATGNAAYEDAARISYIQAQLENQRAVASRARLRDQVLPHEVESFAREHGLPTNPAAAAKLIPGLQAQLEAAQLQQKVDLQQASDLAAKAKEAEVRSDKPADDLMRRSQEMYAKAFFGENVSPAATYQFESRRIDLERADALKTAKEKHESAADVQEINKAFDLQKIAAFLTYLEAAGRVLQRIALEAPPGNAADLRAEREALDNGRKTIYLNGRGGELNPALFGVGATPLPPAGYISPRQQLSDARTAGRRALSLADLQGQLAGADSGTQMNQAFALRIATARAEYDAEMRIANLKTKDDEAEQARIDALDAFKEKKFDAELQREQTLLEIAIKQKEEFENLAAGLVGAGLHGGGRGIANFLRGQMDSILERAVGNIAGLAWGGIAKVIPHATAGSTLGKVLQGTPFGPDPTKAAMAANTTATAQNTAATIALTKELALSKTGGGGGSVPGIGGGSGGSGIPDIGGDSAGSDPGLYGMDSSTTLSPGVQTIPDDPNSPVGNQPGDPYSTQSSALGKAAGIGVAAFGIGHGIADIASGAGGVGRKIGGAGQIAAGAGALIATLAPALAAAGPIGMIAGLGLGLVSSLFGDPRAARRAQIQHALERDQWMEPVAINASMGTNGGYADFDRFGGVRSSNLSPFPTVQQGYFDYRYHATVPGRTVNDFGGPQPTLSANVTVNALDSKSIVDNHAAIVDAVHQGLTLGSGNSAALRDELRR